MSAYIRLEETIAYRGVVYVSLSELIINLLKNKDATVDEIIQVLEQCKTQANKQI